MAFVGRLFARHCKRLIPGQRQMAYSDVPAKKGASEVTEAKEADSAPYVMVEPGQQVIAGYKSSVPYSYLTYPMLMGDPSEYVLPDPGYTGTESDALLYPLTASNVGDKFDPFYLAYFDPHFGKVQSKAFSAPNTLGESIGLMRFELLGHFMGDDDPHEYLMRPVRVNATRDDPLLVPITHLHQQRMTGCVCDGTSNHIFFHQLNRNLPQRCKCGYWFMLVQYELYEKHVENYRVAQWHKIKDEPDWINYMEEREKAKKEMLKILSQIEDAEEFSREDHLLHDKLLDVEKKILGIRDQIEAKYFPEYKQCIH